MPTRIPKTDEQRLEYVPLYRPFLTTLPIPTAGICDAPCSVYQINNEWRKYFIGVMQVLAQDDIWDSEDAAERDAAVQQVKEFIGMTPCSCDSLGGGFTVRNNQDLIISINNITIFEADGLDGVAPDRPDTFFDEDTGDAGDDIVRRQVALCWAVHDYVTSVAEKGILQGIEITAAIGFAATGLSFIFSPIVGIPFGLITVALIELFNREFTGPDDIQQVACCMIDNLTGLAITEANFAAALDDCPDLSGFGAEALQSLTAGNLGELSHFLAFVKSLSSYFGATDSLSECPCPTGECLVDFTIDDGGFDAQIGANGPLATYDDGVGWDNGPSGVINHRIHIEFAFSEDIAITSAGWTITYNSSNNIQWRLILFDDVGGELLNVFDDFDENTLSHDFNFAEETGVRKIRFTVVTTSSGADFNGHIVSGRYIGDICEFPAQE